MIENILKDSLLPIATEYCYETGKQIWQTDKISSIVLFIAGFILTTIGSFITMIIILLIIFRRQIFNNA